MELENRQLELKLVWLNKLVSVLEGAYGNTEFNVAMLCQLGNESKTVVSKD